MKVPESTSHAPPPCVVSTSPKYNTFVASMDVEELQHFCFVTKGRAQNMFCTKKDCKISHQGNCTVMPVAPGEVYVKDTYSAFCTPLVDTIMLDNQLAGFWHGLSLSLEEWGNLISTLSNKLQNLIKTEKETSSGHDKGSE